MIKSQFISHCTLYIADIYYVNRSATVTNMTFVTKYEGHSEIIDAPLGVLDTGRK